MNKNIALPQMVARLLGTYGANENFFTLKGELEAIFAGLRLKKASYAAVKNNPSYHPGRCAAVSIDGVEVGIMGQVHPLVAKNYGIDVDVYCAEINFTAIMGLLLPVSCCAVLSFLTFTAVSAFPKARRVWPSPWSFVLMTEP